MVYIYPESLLSGYFFVGGRMYGPRQCHLTQLTYLSHPQHQNPTPPPLPYLLPYPEPISYPIPKNSDYKSPNSRVWITICR